MSRNANNILAMREIELASEIPLAEQHGVLMHAQLWHRPPEQMMLPMRKLTFDQHGQPLLDGERMSDPLYIYWVLTIFFIPTLPRWCGPLRYIFRAKRFLRWGLTVACPVFDYQQRHRSRSQKKEVLRKCERQVTPARDASSNPATFIEHPCEQLEDRSRSERPKEELADAIPE